MIIDSPNPEDIGVIADKQQVDDYKQKVQFGTGSLIKDTILKEQEYAALQHIAQHKRLEVLKQMRSKNKSSNRRAKKKIADASKRRNRK